MIDRTKRASGAALSLALFFLLTGWAGAARAHGRPALIGDLRFHPTDPDVIVARATFGLVLTEDGGETWRWICAAVTGADPTREDPAIEVTGDGAILVGTYDGLARSADGRCAFEPVPGPIGEGWVIDMDLRRAAPDTIFAIRTSGTDPDQLFRSDDGGRSFAAVGDPVEDVLLEKVRVAPSDPSRIYLSGFISSGASGGREAYVLRSSDGGETFERALVPLEDGERNLHLYAVDPTDPDRLLVRVTRRVTDDRAERLLLSEDGGQTFTTAMSARSLSDAAFSEDGAQAWATARDIDGLFRSDDGGRTFTQLAPGNLPCVETRPGELWLCVDQLRDGYAMGRSADGGDTVEPALRFSQIVELPDCPTCSETAYVCRAWFPDLAYDLGLDAGTAPPEGGMTGAPRDAAPPAVCVDGAVIDAGARRDGGIGMDGGVDGGGGGCGCRIATSGATERSAAWGWLGLLGLLLARSRARARSRRRGLRVW